MSGAPSAIAAPSERGWIERAWPWAFAACWASLWWLVARAFAASGSAVDGFNSDGALPVWMSNGRGVSPYWLYYLGQDRFGAWPFLALNGLGRALGHAWSPDDLGFVQAAFVALAAVPLVMVHGRFGAAVASAFMLVAALHPSGRRLFQVDSVYGWQLGALAWCWLCFRRVAERTGRARAAYTAAASVAALLACWTSTVSGPVLLSWVAVQWLWTRRALMPLLGATVFGVLGEALLRRTRHAYAVEVLGDRSFTSIRPDWGHLGDNVAALGSAFVHESRWWPLAAAGALVTVMMLIEARPLARGLLEMALAGAAFFAVAATVTHVRQSGYEPRYLTLAQLFGAVLGVVGLAGAALMRLPERWRTNAAPALLAAGLLATGLAIPRSTPSPALPRLREAALWASSDRSPSKVVFGTHWDTYVLGAFAPELVPVVLDGDWQRMPWNVQRLREAKRVVLSDVAWAKGSAEPWFSSLGLLLQRESSEPAFRNEEVSLWAYANRTSAAVPVRMAERFSPCSVGSHELSFAAAQRGWILVHGDGALGTDARLELEGGGARAVQAGEQLWALHFESPSPIGIARLAIGSAGPAEPCTGKVWFVPE